MAMTGAGTTSGAARTRVGFGTTIVRGVAAGLASGTIWWLVELAVNWACGGVIPLGQALTVLALDLVVAGIGGLVVGVVLALLGRGGNVAAYALGLTITYG